MVKKDGKQQIFSCSFIAEGEGEVSVTASHGGHPIPMAFRFEHGQQNAQAVLSWRTEGGVIRFKVVGFAKGLDGLGATRLTQLGIFSGEWIYIEVAYAAIGGFSRLVNVFLYSASL